MFAEKCSSLLDVREEERRKNGQLRDRDEASNPSFGQGFRILSLKEKKTPSEKKKGEGSRVR